MVVDASSYISGLDQRGFLDWYTNFLRLRYGVLVGGVSEMAIESPRCVVARLVNSFPWLWSLDDGSAQRFVDVLCGSSFCVKGRILGFKVDTLRRSFDHYKEWLRDSGRHLDFQIAFYRYEGFKGVLNGLIGSEFLVAPDGVVFSPVESMTVSGGVVL